MGRDRFQQLQDELRQGWDGIDFGDGGDYDILVVPSASLDPAELAQVAGVQHYEERLLFSLIRLRHPRTRLIYVTSQPLAPIVIDYYLQLLPGVPFSHARDRLLNLSVFDNSLRPLSEKLLERPRLLERIRQAMRPGRSVMTCYNATAIERQLALALDLPLFATDPELAYWGTKAGSRDIFAECQLPHPPGTGLARSPEELARKAARLWQAEPQLPKLVIKLNEGISGEGNAILDPPDLTGDWPRQGGPAELEAAIATALPRIRFQGPHETWPSYRDRFAQMGVLAEGFIDGAVKRSPSVQGYIHPSGRVEVLSTHDQILGGPDGQIYLGCRFPAAAEYRLPLQHYGQAVGEALARRGSLDRYGVDFVAVQQDDGSWDLQAIEINLRKGGTTHPFMTLKYLTNGHYDPRDGTFRSHSGQEKHYVATDNLCHPAYHGLLPRDLMDIIAEQQLHFDSSTKTGTIFHMIGCLSEFGKLGMTCIGNSAEEADAIYRRVEQILIEEGSQGDRATALPLSWRS